MIKKIECYMAVCDVCQKFVDEDAEIWTHYNTEAEATDGALEVEDYGGGGGKMIDGKLACSKCWTYDDDDEIVIRH